MSARRTFDAEPIPTPAAIAGKVRIPAALALARQTWRGLQQRHAELQAELRRQIIQLEPLQAAHEREPIEARLREIDIEITALAGRVRGALAAVSSATPAFARAIEVELAPLRHAAAAEAVDAIDMLAAAMSRLDSIDRELAPLDSRLAWNLRRLYPALTPLKHRIVGLLR